MVSWISRNHASTATRDETFYKAAVSTRSSSARAARAGTSIQNEPSFGSTNFCHWTNGTAATRVCAAAVRNQPGKQKREDEREA